MSCLRGQQSGRVLCNCFMLFAALDDGSSAWPGGPETLPAVRSAGLAGDYRVTARFWHNG
jgi:hypothetical protein